MDGALDEAGQRRDGLAVERLAALPLDSEWLQGHDGAG
jgi:hypothetical protein